MSEAFSKFTLIVSLSKFYHITFLTTGSQHDLCASLSFPPELSSIH